MVGIVLVGTLTNITANFINPYDGTLLTIDGDYYINDTFVSGTSGTFDLLIGSTHDQYYRIEDEMGNRLIDDNFEYILPAPGDDIILLASTTNVMGDLIIQGSNGNDIIWSGAGNDLIEGGYDSDILNGGLGNDIIDGGIHNDILMGGSGDDTYIFDIGDGIDTITEFSGFDTMLFTGGIVLTDLAFTQTGDDLRIDVSGGLSDNVTVLNFYDGIADHLVEQIQFSDSSIFDLTSLLGGVIIGTNGNDTLVGTNYNDTIDGALGSDLLSGGAGDDTLIYSNDAVWVSGFVAWNVGAPDAIINGDRVTVAPRYRSYDGFDGGDGVDTIQMGSDGDAIFLDDRYSANPFGYNTARIVDVEIIRAGAGDDIIDLTSKQFSYGDVSLYGDDGNDVLWGNAGNDYIEGGTGNDHLDGASGDDTLVGGAGDDKMYGWSGDDIFIIGEGSDELYSGTGSDIIMFDMIDAFVDTIHDFTVGVGGDVLDISDIIVGYDELTDLITDFVQITDDGTNSYLAVDADGGADNFVQIAMLENIIGITDEAVLITDGNLVI